MAKKEEEVEKTVTVKKPIRLDGLLDGGGWDTIEVPEEVAMEQLSLPPAQRNPQWRNVSLVEKAK